MLGAIRPRDEAVKKTDTGALVERAHMKMPKDSFAKEHMQIEAPQ